MVQGGELTNDEIQGITKYFTDTLGNNEVMKEIFACTLDDDFLDDDTIVSSLLNPA